MCSASVDPMPSSTSTPNTERIPFTIRAGSASPADAPRRTVAKAAASICPDSAAASSGP